MSRRLPEEVRTWVYMLRVVARMRRALEVHLEGYGLTGPQFDVLAQLHGIPPIVQQQLADRLLVSKGNVVGILNRMERAGLLQRRPHPEDARAYLICLTERGMAVADQVIPEHEALIVEYLRLVEPAEREALHSALHKLDRALRRA